MVSFELLPEAVKKLVTFAELISPLNNIPCRHRDLGHLCHRLSTKAINPDIFGQLKNPSDTILKPEKEVMSGKTQTYGHPRL
jgi:hypothetical protein